MHHLGIRSSVYQIWMLFVLQTKHLPRENYGLFVEDPNVLGNASLFKMEQRLLRFGVLDRQLLATMTGSTGAEPRGFDPSGLHKQQAHLTAPAGVTPPVQAQLALGMYHMLAELLLLLGT